MYELKSIMSNLNANVYDCFQTLRTAALRVRNNKNCEQVNQEEVLLICVDENKQYRNILLSSTYDYCKYDTLDEPQPYEGNLREGFYILKNDIVSEKYCFNISPETFICYPFVKFALDNNLIQEEDIIEMLIPRYTISSKVFQNFAALVLQSQQTHCMCDKKQFESEDDETENNKETLKGKIINLNKQCLCGYHKPKVKCQEIKFAKHVINNFIGCLGKNSFESTKVTIVDSLEEACAIYNFETLQEKYVTISQIQQMFLVQTKDYNPMFQNSLPIYNQIIQIGIMQSIQIAVDFSNEKSQVTCYKVDTVSMISPKEGINIETYSVNTNHKGFKQINLKDSQFDFLKSLSDKFCYPDIAEIGGIRLQEYKKKDKQFNILMKHETFDSSICDKQPFNIIKDEDIEQNIEFLKDNYCLIKSAGGFVKLTNQPNFVRNQNEVIVFSTTNIAVDNIRKQGVQNVFTFASCFNENYPQKKLNQYKYSMCKFVYMQTNFTHNIKQIIDCNKFIIHDQYD